MTKKKTEILESMKVSVRLPKKLIKLLKDGWVYELSWDEETDELNLTPMQKFKKQKTKTKK